MKRIILTFVFFAVISTVAVFADHPEGLGIGVQGGTSGSWEGGGGLHNGAALSLKIPSVPLFWAARLDIWEKYFFLSVSGDKYLFDNVLINSINLNWYLGLGLGVALGIGDPFGLAMAGRLPVGLSWQPISLIEVFLQVVPQLGVTVMPDFHFPYGGWGADIGVRVWFK